MNVNDILNQYVNINNVILLTKILFAFALLAEVLMSLIILRQIHGSSRFGSILTHKLLEIFGYINIVVVLILILVLLLL